MATLPHPAPFYPEYYPPEAKYGRAFYGFTLTYDTPGGTASAVYPEGDVSVDEMNEVFGKSAGSDLWLAFNSSDHVLMKQPHGGLVAISDFKLQELWKKLPRTYCVRLNSKYGDNHLFPFYGWGVWKKIREWDASKTPIVVWQKGVEPYVVDCGAYLANYLEGKTVEEVLAQQPA